MKTVNIGEIPGKSFEIIGLVRGSVVRGTAKDFLSRWQNFIGKEMKNHMEMLDKMRNIATSRMENEAEDLFADAILNVTYGSTHIMDEVVEIIAYGTAVKFID